MLISLRHSEKIFLILLSCDRKMNVRSMNDRRCFCLKMCKLRKRLSLELDLSIVSFSIVPAGFIWKTAGFPMWKICILEIDTQINYTSHGILSTFEQISIFATHPVILMHIAHVWVKLWQGMCVQTGWNNYLCKVELWKAPFGKFKIEDGVETRKTVMSLRWE